MACGKAGLKCALTYLLLDDSANMFSCKQNEMRIFVTGAEDIDKELSSMISYASANKEMYGSFDCTMIKVYHIPLSKKNMSLYQLNPMFFNKEFFMPIGVAQEPIISNNPILSYEFIREYMNDQLSIGLEPLIREIYECSENDLFEVIVVGNPSISDVFATMKSIGSLLCQNCMQQTDDKEKSLDFKSHLFKHLKFGMALIEDCASNSQRMPIILKELMNEELPFSTRFYCVEHGMTNIQFFNASHLVTAYCMEKFFDGKNDSFLTSKVFIPKYSIPLELYPNNRKINRDTMGLEMMDWMMLDSRLLMDEILIFELYPQLGSYERKKTNEEIINSLFVYDYYAKRWNPFSMRKIDPEIVREEIVNKFHVMLHRESIFISVMNSISQTAIDRIPTEESKNDFYLYDLKHLELMEKLSEKKRSYMIDSVLRTKIDGKINIRKTSGLKLYEVMKNLDYQRKPFYQIIRDIYQLCSKR